MVGNKMWWDNEMQDAYANNLFKQHIVLAGRRDAAELKNIIGAAFAMLYLSYFEGFGIPVLEGMRAGIPVLAANITAIPEVGADAILYTNPFSQEDIAEKMIQLFQSENLRNDLVKNGLSRAALFSWDNTANKLWQVINKCIDVS
jgi:glycosyltransferase involved in cell wall biosynthesis